MNKLSLIFDDLVELLYPQLCITCGNRLVSQEKYICIGCWLDLPVSRFHIVPENIVAQLFWGRVQIEHATSYFFYQKGSRYQKLIYYIKYKGLKELGMETGKRFGDILSDSDSFKSIDVIVPVPLHPNKQKSRGYNQSEWIGRGLAEVLKKPLDAGNLHRKIHSATQTRKDRFGRWQNVDGIFGVHHPDEFSHKHILVIDDVVTTGSTLEACAFELLKIPGTKVSIATLAIAQ